MKYKALMDAFYSRPPLPIEIDSDAASIIFEFNTGENRTTVELHAVSREEGLYHIINTYEE